MNTTRRTITALAAFAGYWGLGSVSGFFAIPPGYASPIWPAAGFALLVIVEAGPWALAGIWAASFLLNLGFSHASILHPSPAWIGASLIAGGAVLQTLLAYLLVRQFTLFPDLLGRTRDPILFALLGGPAACLVSCSFGVATLYYSGVLPASAIAGNWLNWWIGDSIGVMTLAPVILTLNGRRRGASGTTAWSFIFFYFLLVIIASAVFVQSREDNEKKIEDVFNERAEGINQTLIKQTENLSHASYTLATLFSTFGTISFGQFRRYAKEVYEHIPGTHAYSWIPIVQHSERSQYEQMMADYLHRPFVFQQRAANGELEPAGEREQYFPVYYIAPLDTNQRALGFDLGSAPDRLAAINLARQLQTTVATQPIELVQQEGTYWSFLLVTPIERKGEVKSLVSCVFLSADLIKAALDPRTTQQISISISDVTDTGPPQPLYVSTVTGTEYKSVKFFTFAQRKWQITYSPSAEYLALNQGQATWMVLIAGFLYISIFGLFVLLLMSRKSAVETEVLLKTKQLQDALAHAESANQVKSNFLASMSHELRTPLNSIIGFSVRSLKKLEGSNEQRVQDSLAVIEKNGRYLLSLINDILDLSKIEAGKMEIVKTNIAITETCNEIIQAMRPLAEPKGLQLLLEPGPVASLYADSKRFKQILVNLLANAIKFTASGSITLQFSRQHAGQQAGVCMRVVDTGAGIEAKDLQRLFMRFEQLGADFKSQDLGSGLGLSLVLELVSIHGGTVNVESTPGSGSVFSVWLPDGPTP